MFIKKKWHGAREDLLLHKAVNCLGCYYEMQGHDSLVLCPKQEVFLLPTVCDESFAVNGSVVGKWPYQRKTREEKKRGREHCYLVSQMVNCLQGSKGKKGGGGKGSKKEPLHSYRADTNACNIHRTTK